MSILIIIVKITIDIKMNNTLFKTFIIKFLFFIRSPPSFGQSPRLMVDTQNIVFHRNYYINLIYLSQYKNKHFFALRFLKDSFKGIPLTYKKNQRLLFDFFFFCCFSFFTFIIFFYNFFYFFFSNSFLFIQSFSKHSY